MVTSDRSEETILTEPIEHDLGVPSELRGEIEWRGACALLASWGHPAAERWLEKKTKDGAVRSEGDPPRLEGSHVWRELLRDECDKLYNQAWCALEQIREGEDEESVLLLGIDALPSSVEQAFCLAPSLAGEIMGLLREHKPERYEDIRRELRVGTDGEAAERVACLAFWEENDETMSDLRRTLFRLVREGLG